MSPAPLSKEDRAILAEYERIVDFTNKFIAGTQPCGRIPEGGFGDKDETKHYTAAEDQSAGATDMGGGQHIKSILTKEETRPAPSEASLDDYASSEQAAPSSTTTHGTFQAIDYKQASASTSTQGTFQGIDIDYKHNYYKDLGVQKEDNITIYSIKAGYNHKSTEFAPGSARAKEWLKHGGGRSRTKYNEMWLNIHKAYSILSDPTVRRHYDANYIEPSEEEKKELKTRRAMMNSRIKRSRRGRYPPNKGQKEADLTERISRAGREAAATRDESRPVPNVEAGRIARSVSYTPSAPRAMIANARRAFKGKTYSSQIDKSRKHRR